MPVTDFPDDGEFIPHPKFYHYRWGMGKIRSTNNNLSQVLQSSTRFYLYRKITPHPPRSIQCVSITEPIRCVFSSCTHDSPAHQSYSLLSQWLDGHECVAPAMVRAPHFSIISYRAQCREFSVRISCAFLRTGFPHNNYP